MPVQCPSCGNIEFQICPRANLELAGEVITEIDVKKVYSCIVCDYTISEVSDLELLTITVYIIGDSISGRRQGLRRVTEAIGFVVGTEGQMVLLANQGGFPLELGDGTIAWVFTKSGWKRFDADPVQRLANKQHIVKIEEMV